MKDRVQLAIERTRQTKEYVKRVEADFPRSLSAERLSKIPKQE